MRRWNVRHLRVALPLKPPLHAPRLFHSSTPSSSAITLPLQWPTETFRGRDPVESIRRSKYEALTDAISLDHVSPSRAWGYYNELLHLMPADELPLELHQQVLRKCVPPKHAVRAAMIRKYAEGRNPKTPYIYEFRLQAVIRNMRATALTPALDDYHFILEQFSAVGHYLGSHQVLQELKEGGVTPTSKTYGLCLQALAYRLALPCNRNDRPRLVHEITRMCEEYLTEMKRYGISFTSVNYDLALRVLRETADYETFETLLRVGYGVDLKNPDCLPLEFQEKSPGFVKRSVTAPIAEPLPFSTAALNNTIDTLGRMGRVSKLVQAFEVLTASLPSQQNELASAYEDDDDFGVPPPPTPAPTIRLPFAEPNTTSYVYLVRHLSKAGHRVFARHYLYQAVESDRLEDRRLRGDLTTKAIHEIEPPKVAVNRGTILPVYGLANTQKDTQLMKWTLKICERVLRRKKVHTRHYTGILRTLEDQDASSQLSESSTIPSDSSAGAASSATVSKTPRAASTDNAASTSSRPNNQPMQTTIDQSALDVDLDAPPIPSSPPPRVLDLRRHLSILRRDITEIQHLARHIAFSIGRNAERIKERLGRRVWMAKDIYLHSENRRMQVPRDRWRKIVNFRSKELRDREYSRREGSGRDSSSRHESRRPPIN
ncbi:hypothetical protein JAAARDRAFT_238051 [Jaapia argillacea MUCL 33604]|uniref:Uncharacterized protein n=1 Tax=Jaapia argillacea MUCL 33604 TaxID=933084 RepID=A0A067QMM9_9AGAM|nr:hypothetical protein JAAARDRAFT_238051 [Jaapia argillacea MUCL 33604]